MGCVGVWVCFEGLTGKWLKTIRRLIGCSNQSRTEAKTYIIVNILSSNVEHGSREIRVRHLEGIIEAPERRAKRVTYPGETTT